MRKLIFILMLILISCFESNSLTTLANTSYARVEKTTEIFKTNSDNESIDNIICLAEETYFVEIIADYDSFYKVSYNGITGYIKKTDVKEIQNTPITPYPYNIQIITDSTCNLRSTPTTRSNTNNVITTVYIGSEDITFIGRTIGEEAIDFGGNTWYYVCYKGNYGYIYNNYVKSVTPIYKNTENYTYAESISDRIENPITHTPSLIIIIILSIPLILMLIILYIPHKPKIKSKKQKVIKEIERY